MIIISYTIHHDHPQPAEEELPNLRHPGCAPQQPGQTVEIGILFFFQKNYSKKKMGRNETKSGKIQILSGRHPLNLSRKSKDFQEEIQNFPGRIPTILRKKS